MSLLTDILINVVSGALGGKAAGSVLKTDKGSALGNIISGALGGGIGGQLLSSLIPALANAAQTGGIDIGVMLGQAAGGGITGAIVTLAYNMIKKRLVG
jgi:hypothetical protein